MNLAKGILDHARRGNCVTAAERAYDAGLYGRALRLFRKAEYADADISTFYGQDVLDHLVRPPSEWTEAPSFDGRFFTAQGDAHPPGYTPVSPRAVDSRGIWNYNARVTADGTLGNRVIWLTYTSGVRQACVPWKSKKAEDHPLAKLSRLETIWWPFGKRVTA